MRYLCGAASGSKFVCKNCLIASESQDPASPASSAMQPSGVSSDGGPASLDSSSAIKIRRKYGRVFNRFDAVSAYMRKMDHYGLSDFFKNQSYTVAL